MSSPLPIGEQAEDLHAVNAELRAAGRNFRLRDDECRSFASKRGCANKSLLVVARKDGAITGVDCAVCGTPWKCKPLAECQPEE